MSSTALCGVSMPQAMSSRSTFSRGRSRCHTFPAAWRISSRRVRGHWQWGGTGLLSSDTVLIEQGVLSLLAGAELFQTDLLRIGPGATLRLQEGGDQIGFDVPINIDRLGVLDLNGTTEGIGALTLT